jgi:hypothetical protein
MLNVSIFGNTADIYAIVHLVAHACQHITADQSHSSRDTVAEILEMSGEWRHKDDVLYKPPEKKTKSHGVKSGDRGGHRINASSSFPLHPIQLCPIEIPSHVFVVVSRRAVLLKDVIITVFIQLWHQSIF